MEVEVFLDFTGPDDLSADARNAVGTCALVAAAAAGVAAIATNGAAVAAAAGPAFSACMAAKGVQEEDKYSVAFRTAAGWTDWA